MGFMMRTALGEVLAKYGDTLSLAVIGAIEKKDEIDDVRVIFDTTHRVLTNHAIKVQDQPRNPISVDVKVVMTEMARRRRTRFSIAYDVRFAHRQILVEEVQWGRLGCQIEGTAAEWMRSRISAAIAMAAEKDVVKGPRPRTRLGLEPDQAFTDRFLLRAAGGGDPAQQGWDFLHGQCWLSVGQGWGSPPPPCALSHASSPCNLAHALR